MEGFFTDKRVLIIGGTGTIGQGLLKKILKDKPAVVRIFSRDEYKQSVLQNEFLDQKNIRWLIGDVRDEDRVVRAMKDIDYVFHVAAMKHVPACEYNPFEAVQTNIIGTQNIIKASLENRVKKTIFTSTDKAISPTNTYGASKLMAERLIANAQYNSGSNETIFAVVRFGNVIGSRGSVIPLFLHQARHNGHITVTDPQMTRFMMTLDQATSLTIKAMEEAQGGEVFVLKMPVIKLENLVDCLLDEMHVRYGLSDIQVKIMGLRPGEKMYEELMTEEEAKDAIELPNMFVIPNPLLEHKPEYSSGRRAEIKRYDSSIEELLGNEGIVQFIRSVIQEDKVRTW